MGARVGWVGKFSYICIFSFALAFSTFGKKEKNMLMPSNNCLTYTHSRRISLLASSYSLIL